MITIYQIVFISTVISTLVAFLRNRPDHIPVTPVLFTSLCNTRKVIRGALKDGEEAAVARSCAAKEGEGAEVVNHTVLLLHR